MPYDVLASRIIICLNNMKLLKAPFLLLAILLTRCGQPAAALTITPSISELPPMVISPSPLPSFTPRLESTETIAAADCKKIAFTLFNSHDQVQPDIYTICPDGSLMTRLTNDPAADETPVWSPDGTRLAFASNRSGSYQIYLMDAEGGNVSQVTTEYENTHPVWLADGLRIAFRAIDNKGLWWWRTAHLDGSQVTELSEPSYDFFFQTPAWSPDGARIAYMSLEEQKMRNDGASQIHVKDINGANDIALTHDTWENATPIWSPDGNRIAFLSERHGEYNIFALYVMDADGSKVRLLSQPIYGDVSASFSWSPDGTQIVIGDVNIGYIAIITLASGEARELLNLKEGESAFAPSWQP